MRDYSAEIIDNKQTADGIFIMTLGVEYDEQPLGGQFVHVRLDDCAHILRRPFCVCDFGQNFIKICYAVTGDGTRRLSLMRPPQKLSVMMFLGNGWAPAPQYKKILLVGGGMGAAVLPAVIRAFPDRQYEVCLGFANSAKAVLASEMAETGANVEICTDDGSLGTKGFVTASALEKIESFKPDAVFCCGPEPMYKALQKAAFDLPVYVSLEQRMGCGLGACLVCSCKIKTADGEKYMRVCADGPVFELGEVAL